MFALALAVAVDGFTMQNESLDDALYTNDLLWQGMDVDEGTFAVDQMVFRQAIGAVEKRVCGKGNTLIVGPFDSGTNLMQMLVQRNFPSVVLPCHCSEASTPRFWKHSNSGPLEFKNAVQRAGLNPAAVKVIVLLRSPLSQAVSWRKAPYNLEPCTAKLYDRWKFYCSARIAASVDLCKPRSPFGLSTDDTRPVGFQNTIEVYNAYVRQYLSLASSGWFSGVHIVTYEEILYQPEAVIEELARFLEAPMPVNVDICSAPAKGHGNAHGRDLALQMYRQRPWLHSIGGNVRTFCSLIDMGLLENLTEGKGFVAELGGEALPYSHDCRDQAT